MKKLVFAMLAIVLFASCNSTTDGFSVDATIEGDIKNGTKVYLKRINAVNQPITVDSTLVKNGKFSFNGKADSLEIQYIFVDSIYGNIPIIRENGELEIEFHKDSIGIAKIKGTEQNDLFAKFLNESRLFSERAMSMRKDFEKARISGDIATQDALKEESMEMQEQAKNFELSYIKENPNALISIMLLERILQTKALPENEVIDMYDALTEKIKATSSGLKIKEELEKTKKIAIGAKAPNFSAPTPNGDQLALKDALGKITIVDFWASWCKPCRAENPNLVRIYNQYKDSGLRILGVSLDKNKEVWTDAIATDGLEWNHVSNVDYFDEIANLYNVKAIPAMFILDQNGVIIAKNLRGEDLENKIKELMDNI